MKLCKCKTYLCLCYTISKLPILFVINFFDIAWWLWSLIVSLSIRNSVVAIKRLIEILLPLITINYQFYMLKIAIICMYWVLFSLLYETVGATATDSSTDEFSLIWWDMMNGIRFLPWSHIYCGRTLFNNAANCFTCWSVFGDAEESR